MPLTNDDIIAGLVAYYKRTGVDMTSLLGDPTFQGMKTVQKVQAIKDYAKVIHEGSSDSLSSGEKGAIAANAAWRGFVPMIPAIGAIGAAKFAPLVLAGAHRKALLVSGLTGIAMGASLGALQGYLMARQNQVNKQSLRANLANVVNNPTTTNAVGVLASSNIAHHTQGALAAITNRAIGKLEDTDTAAKTVELYNDSLPDFQREEADRLGVKYIDPNIKITLPK